MKGSFIQITEDLMVSYSSSVKAPFILESGLEVSATLWKEMDGQLRGVPFPVRGLTVSFLITIFLFLLKLQNGFLPPLSGVATFAPLGLSSYETTLLR